MQYTEPQNLPPLPLEQLIENHLHHVTLQDVKNLEAKFAYLTENGWVIPHWVQVLRATAKPNRRIKWA